MLENDATGILINYFNFQKRWSRHWWSKCAVVAIKTFHRIKSLLPIWYRLVCPACKNPRRMEEYFLGRRYRCCIAPIGFWNSSLWDYVFSHRVRKETVGHLKLYTIVPCTTGSTIVLVQSGKTFNAIFLFAGFAYYLLSVRHLLVIYDHHFDTNQLWQANFKLRPNHRWQFSSCRRRRYENLSNRSKFSNYSLSHFHHSRQDFRLYVPGTYNYMSDGALAKGHILPYDM